MWVAYCDVRESTPYHDLIQVYAAVSKAAEQHTTHLVFFCIYPSPPQGVHALSAIFHCITVISCTSDPFVKSRLYHSLSGGQQSN